MKKPYVGRFAPTPSGGLHLGSLASALASYLDARSVNGQWLLRIEDVDPPRQIAGAKDSILYTLEGCGFEWDKEVVYQSQRFNIYEAIIEGLFQSGQAYACTCARKVLENNPVYPNSCRDTLKLREGAAIRVRVCESMYQFTDKVQGCFSQRLGRDVGDFVIKRREGFYAYQLAAVIDDALQGVTDIVRGADLLDSTPRQIYLQEILGFTTPSYMHVPVLVDYSGHKLSKSRSSPAIDSKEASNLLIKSLTLLGQKDTEQLQGESPSAILKWAVANWQAEAIPKKMAIIVNGEFS